MQFMTPLCLIVSLFAMSIAHGESGQLKQSLDTAEQTQKWGNKVNR